MRETYRNIIILTLRLLSKLVLWKYKPRIVCITGSVGKTSTKDAIYAVLSKFTYVRKSNKSYNSEIGLPLTILGIPNGWNDPSIWIKNFFKGLWLFLYPHRYPKWLVLEVGVGKPGDMARTASWLKSDVVLVTAIGDMPPHIEFFDSHKHLVEEKSLLIKTLKKEGILIINSDDEIVLNMKSKSKARLITYGFKEGADILGSDENILYSSNGVPMGAIFRINKGENSIPVSIEGAFGRNHIYAALASMAFAFGLKLNMLSAAEALKHYEIPPGRMRLLKGINDSLIIDDTYNSSPAAAEAALNTLAGVKTTGRKIAVMGDMLELGKHTEEAHRDIGKLVNEKVDVLMVVGPRAQYIKDGALENGMKKGNIFEFSNSFPCSEFLKDYIKKGDLVFIKGSQGMRMERVTEAVLEDKKNKENLLVRQEKEWLNKI